MTMFSHFHKSAALCGCLLLLCFGATAGADEIQDINKLLKQGKTDEALERINTYLASKPKDAQGRFEKGLILTEQGKTNDAIRVFSDLTEDYPELPEPYNNLAVLYAGQGQYDKARIALEMAIRTHPSYATAHENLGDIYAKMASQAYDRALQLDRSNTSTQTKLALIKDLFSNTKAGKPAKGTTAPAKPQPAETVAAAMPAPVAAPEKADNAPPAKAAPEKTAAAEPAPQPAARPAPPVKLTGNAREDVLKTVHRWAAAWSAKNVPEYLSFYADDFAVPDGLSRAAWEKQRSERISKPASIQVGLSDIQVKVTDGTHASATFKQSYRASHLKTHSGKTLLLVKSNGSWLIQEERTGK